MHEGRRRQAVEDTSGGRRDERRSREGPLHLLLFARYPVPGEAKTRLVPALGPEGAARLHRRMTEEIARVARGARNGCAREITICFTGARTRDFRAWLGTDFRYFPQSSGDLGVRLRDAFAAAFRGGARAVAAVGADVPALSAAIVEEASGLLRASDVVLGPAVDGGYYLIGMRRDLPQLFTGVEWGSGRVRAQTLANAERLGVGVAELPVLADIDRPEDLPALRGDPRFADVWDDDPLLSVIVPTLNEEETLGPTLEAVRRSGGVEVIVADGGSKDATREIAARFGARVLEVGGGRAAQLNAGAAAAGGRHLLFLHADTLLPGGYPGLIRRALAPPSTVAGAFGFRTDGAGACLRLVEWGANIRSGVFRRPYGDQGLFLEKRVFDEFGGFAPLPIMEDYELVNRLRRRGRIALLSQAAVTSARRWQQLGVLRTFVRNQAVIAGFHLGVPPERLARFYRGIP